MFLYKVVLIGDFGVGKTCLVRRFVDNTFSEEYISSFGVSISKKQIKTENNQSTMMIWDTEGRTHYKPIFKQYLLGAKGFIIVADLTRKKTIESIFDHIDICNDTVSNVPIFIALNKSDAKEFEYDKQKIFDYSDNIIGIYETSAKSGDTVNTIFDELNKIIIKRDNNVK